MNLLSGTVLRVFLAISVALAALAIFVVFSGILPPHHEREFSDKDFGPPLLHFSLVEYEDLEGWPENDPGEALDAFLRSCEALAARDADAPANPLENLGLAGTAVSLGGTVGDWLAPCEAARPLAGGSDAGSPMRRAALRAFFEFHFQPVAIAQRREPLAEGRARRAGPRIDADGTFTGYFEPIYQASKTPAGQFTAPVLPRPDDLVEVDLSLFRPDLAGERIAGRVENGRLRPYADRATIETGEPLQAPLAWLDPNDLFFLQIQGSGRLAFPDGAMMRVGYAGQNGHPYTAIGRVMVEREIMPLEAVSMQSIREWLENAAAHEAQGLREENASYVFFRPLDEVADDLGPLGAQGVPLTPGRSLAVDRRHHAMGAPVWVDIEAQPGVSDAPLRRLMIAQDTGGAIRGPVRGDVFWGAGAEAGERAGLMNAQGTMTVLLPRRLAEALSLGDGGVQP